MGYTKKAGSTTNVADGGAYESTVSFFSDASANIVATAATAATSALASKDAAALSAADALASKNDAETQASTATTQAGISTTQAGISTTQASAAAVSASEAAASAATITIPLELISGGTGVAANTALEARSGLGLGNVDNTSDNNKPVSTSQQTALNLKANLISPVLVTPALGTPSSGVVTNLTGTASININGTVGATTPSSVASTTLSSTTDATLSGVRVGKGAGAIATNTAVGSGALNANTTGASNTASGLNALSSNTTGSGNTATGQNALQNNTTGFNNTASGLIALNSNTTGNSNTASGVEALFSNTTGVQNTANGREALYSNTTGSYNTASGRAGLYYNTTGSGNTALNPLSSVSDYNPVFNPTTENNRFCMGSTAVTNAYIQVAWTVVSDARDKINFAPVPHGLEFVKALQPTAYQFRTARDSEETNGGVRYGFKAQDVLALEGDNPVIVDNEDEDKLRMVDTALIPVLVKAVKELSAKVDELQTEINTLKGN